MSDKHKAQTRKQDNQEIQEEHDKRDAINKFRYEMADDFSAALGMGMGMGLGPWGAGGYSSEYMVRRMIEAQEKQMQNQGR